MPPDELISGGHLLARTRDYWLYGLRARSEIELPDWPVTTFTEPDVTIKREALSVPEPVGPPYTARSTLEGGELRLAILGVGRYAASGGNLIRVDPDPQATPEDIRLYLTGALMGTILHQRGAYPLHASCVALAGVPGAVGFAGRSGAGKSTMVAALVRRGAAFVSDDICVMAPSAPGGLRVWPGAARVKLDEIGLGVLPGATADLDPAGGNRGKFHLPMDGTLDREVPVPLSRVYLLTDGEEAPRLERLTGLDAVSALVDETYLLATAHSLGLISQVFGLAARVAQTLPVIRLIRPRGLEYLPAVAALVEQDAHHPEG